MDSYKKAIKVVGGIIAIDGFGSYIYFINKEAGTPTLQAGRLLRGMLGILLIII